MTQVNNGQKYRQQGNSFKKHRANINKSSKKKKRKRNLKIDFYMWSERTLVNSSPMTKLIFFCISIKNQSRGTNFR